MIRLRKTIFGGGAGSGGGGRPAFWLPMNDAGAGAVNTTPSIATGSPTATFTRATTATTVLSTGLIGSVASGTARSTYSPTGVYLGYLAEEARTNLIIQSADFATTWTVSNGSISANTVTGPDGTATADKVVPDGTTTLHSTQQSIAKAASALTYTISVYAKASGYNFLAFRIDASAGNGVWAVFNLNTGVVDTAATAAGAGWTGTGATITQAANGFYRCALTVTTSTEVAIRPVFCPFSSAAQNPFSATFAGDTVSAVALWGAQLEQGAFATSYIPTTTASVTRNADLLTYPLASNASNTAGTAYAELSTVWTGTLANQVALSLTDATGQPLVPQTSTGTSVYDGNLPIAKTGLAELSTASRKRASRWDVADSVMRVTGDGASVATGAFDGTMGPGTGNINIGSTGAGNVYSGTIKNVRIWTRALADSNLVSLTS